MNIGTTRRSAPAFAIVAALVVLCAADARAQSSFSGTLTSNTTWRLTDSPIQVNPGLRIPAGVTLTIEAGVIVQFAQDATLQIDGTLVARGTAAAPIRFTSNQTTVTAGYWGEVWFSDSSVDATYSSGGAYTGGSALEYVIVEGAGSLSDPGLAIYVTDAAPLIRSVTLRNNRGLGLFAGFRSDLPSPAFKIFTSDFTGQSAGGIDIRYPNHAVTLEGNRIDGGGVAGKARSESG